MVQCYMTTLRARGGHVSQLLAEATAMALIENHPEMNLGHIDLQSTSWSHKAPISEDLKKGIELTYLHDIVKTIEEYNIPPPLVNNLDQSKA